MEKAILYKILQRRYKFRNPDHLTKLPDDFLYTSVEYLEAKEYLLRLQRHQIKCSYPEAPDYPAVFLRMKEPPLFFEYTGAPIWESECFLSIVGSREMAGLTSQWLRHHLTEFLKLHRVGVVSGGAKGVDQLAHLIALKNQAPTIFVLPCGLLNLYPPSLHEMQPLFQGNQACFLSEFELDHKIHKSHFYFRNRLIAALGKVTLVAQASLKSGSLLTVHHSLEYGRPILTIPSHPELLGFEGNLKLLQEGAFPVRNYHDMHDFWVAETWPN